MSLRDIGRYQKLSHERVLGDLTITKSNSFKGENFLKKEFPIFIPPEGDNVIRILPPTWQDIERWGKYWAILCWVHYEVGPDNSSVLCLKKMLNENCPICEERSKAFEANERDYAKKLYPSERYLLWIINRKNENQGPVPWVQPKKIKTDIDLQIIDRVSGKLLPIDDILEGYDVSFVKEKTDEGTFRGVQYKGVSVSRHASPVGTEDEIIKYLEYIEKTPITEILHFHTYEQIVKLMSGKGGNETANVIQPVVNSVISNITAIKPVISPTPEQVVAPTVLPQTQPSAEDAIEALKKKYLRK